MNLIDLEVTKILKGPEKRTIKKTGEVYYVLEVEVEAYGRTSVSTLTFMDLSEAEAVSPGYVFQG